MLGAKDMFVNSITESQKCEKNGHIKYNLQGTYINHLYALSSSNSFSSFPVFSFSMLFSFTDISPSLLETRNEASTLEGEFSLPWKSLWLCNWIDKIFFTHKKRWLFLLKYRPCFQDVYDRRASKLAL